MVTRGSRKQPHLCPNTLLTWDIVHSVHCVHRVHCELNIVFVHIVYRHLCPTTLCTWDIVHIVHIAQCAHHIHCALCTSYSDTYIPPPFLHGAFAHRIYCALNIVHCIVHRIQTLIAHQPSYNVSYMGHCAHCKAGWS